MDPSYVALLDSKLRLGGRFFVQTKSKIKFSCLTAWEGLSLIDLLPRKTDPSLFLNIYMETQKEKNLLVWV